MIIIRPFRKGDTDLVFEFLLSLTEDTRHMISGLPDTREEIVKLTGGDIEDPDSLRFMACQIEDDREVMVGYVFFFVNWSKRVPWVGIVVRDGCQGMGLGKKMMLYAIDKAKEYNKGGILLTTRKDNYRAIALYKKLGFDIIGEDPRGEHLMILNFPD